MRVRDELGFNNKPEEKPKYDPYLKSSCCQSVCMGTTYGTVACNACGTILERWKGEWRISVHNIRTYTDYAWDILQKNDGQVKGWSPEHVYLFEKGILEQKVMEVIERSNNGVKRRIPKKEEIKELGLQKVKKEEALNAVKKYISKETGHVEIPF